MDQDRKRFQEDDRDVGDFALKRARTPPPTFEDAADGNSYGEVMAAWKEVDDEASNQLSKLLETESVSAVKVRFIDHPYSSPPIFESSTSYITINGNEEYCGSSFSDSDASVMASIDVRRSQIGVGLFSEAFRAWSSAVGSAGRWDETSGAAACGGNILPAEGTDNSDRSSGIDEEMLCRFLLEDNDDDDTGSCNNGG